MRKYVRLCISVHMCALAFTYIHACMCASVHVSELSMCVLFGECVLLFGVCVCVYSSRVSMEVRRTVSYSMALRDRTEIIKLCSKCP